MGIVYYMDTMGIHTIMGYYTVYAQNMLDMNAVLPLYKVKLTVPSVYSSNPQENAACTGMRTSCAV